MAQCKKVHHFFTFILQKEPLGQLQLQFWTFPFLCNEMGMERRRQSEWMSLVPLVDCTKMNSECAEMHREATRCSPDADRLRVRAFSLANVCLALCRNRGCAKIMLYFTRVVLGCRFIVKERVHWWGCKYFCVCKNIVDVWKIVVCRLPDFELHQFKCLL